MKFLSQSSSPDSEANTEDGDFQIDTSLPKYLIQPSKKGEFSDFLEDVMEDKNETGAGYDSDDNAEEFACH